MRQGMRMAGGGLQFTPLSKLLLSILIGLYITQQVLESWLGFPMLATFGWLGWLLDHLTNQKKEEKIACPQKSRFYQQLSQTELRFLSDPVRI